MLANDGLAESEGGRRDADRLVGGGGVCDMVTNGELAGLEMNFALFSRC